MFEHYKDCLFNSKTITKPQQRFRSDHHRVYTEEVNKIALSSNDDKRLQTFDGITTSQSVLMLLKYVKMKRMIKREPEFKYESEQTFNIEPQQTCEAQQTYEPQQTHEPQQTFNIEPQQTHEPQKTNESQETFNNKPQALRKNQHKKMLNIIKLIVKEFVCKDFDTITSKDKIILKSQQTSVKGYKEGSTVKVIKIDIGRDVITLKSLQLSNVCHARICIKEKK